MSEPDLALDGEIEEHLYKVLVVGDFGVGKTSIIRRYTEGVFSPNYKLTIGVDFALKSISWSDSTKINLQLWDIAGHERFGHMTRVYYKYAIAAIIVFDCTSSLHEFTRQVTFESVSKWLKDVNQKVVLGDNDPVPILLLANKCDLKDNFQVDQNTLDDFCSANKLAGWFPTSAKNNTNVDEAMSFLIKQILNVSNELSRSSPTLNNCENDVIDGPALIQMDEEKHKRNGQIPGKKSDGCCS